MNRGTPPLDAASFAGRPPKKSEFHGTLIAKVEVDKIETPQHTYVRGDEVEIDMKLTEKDGSVVLFGYLGSGKGLKKIYIGCVDDKPAVGSPPTLLKKGLRFFKEGKAGADRLSFLRYE